LGPPRAGEMVVRARRREGITECNPIWSGHRRYDVTVRLARSRGRSYGSCMLPTAGSRRPALPQASGGRTLPPPALGPETGPEVSLPVGTWQVEYANGVTEVCDIPRDGTAVVLEPVRIPGKAVANGGAVVILFDNGRV
jgi:hypothetical protein